MKYNIVTVLILICSSTLAQDTLKIAFGSCNKHTEDQSYWLSIQNHHPGYWYWLGDIIYADTDDMRKMRSMYSAMKSNEYYSSFCKTVKVDGIWDDHDYGANDGGKEFLKKEESKIEFLRFLQLSDSTEIKGHNGVYHTTTQNIGLKSIKTIFLDTRSFRTELQASTQKGRRYEPVNQGDMLGEEQWTWLEKELKDSSISLFIIVSSIQVIANNHWYEKWGNMPTQRDKLIKLLEDKPSIILSGDRHIAEFSSITSGNYSLYDFTSSGLTHTWNKYQFEKNENRVGKQFAKKNYGLLSIYSEQQGLNVTMQIFELPNGKELQNLTLFFPF
jgi:alkaline phosphatase D